MIFSVAKRRPTMGMVGGGGDCGGESARRGKSPSASASCCLLLTGQLRVEMVVEGWRLTVPYLVIEKNTMSLID